MKHRYIVILKPLRQGQRDKALLSRLNANSSLYEYCTRTT